MLTLTPRNQSTNKRLFGGDGVTVGGSNVIWDQGTGTHDCSAKEPIAQKVNHLSTIL